MSISSLVRYVFLVQGQVQGVGFRPFIWRLAHEEGLTGSVVNTAAGVSIEIQGSPGNIERFRRRLRTDAPPLARITNIEAEESRVICGETGFNIGKSGEEGGAKILVSPDTAVCDECLADLRDPDNFRFGYAFTNCTNCGPRFTITRRLPYDRAATTMSCFPLCEKCAAEYADPANRRFHAQPVACPQCGPEIWYVDKNSLPLSTSSPETRDNALGRACELLLEGKILALRGLGGFQLACDATSEQAVALLRSRKNRPHKALAVMAADLDAAGKLCVIDEHSEKLLKGFRKPIVLCPARQKNPLAPDTHTIGLMLPYTPLHALLFEELKAKGAKHPLLVMTSANAQGEPICLGNREALDRLAHLADGWLLHNRDILCRVDDSVAQPGSEPVILRRARGYVPQSICLPVGGLPVLGCGAELKATFCLTRDNRAFPGQHIGDLHSPTVMEFYEEALAHMQNLLEVRPAMIIHDLHPDFMSTQYAKDLARKMNIPSIGLQHHVAHGAACLAENDVWEPALALCLDGSGLGPDGSIWGGELLRIDLSKPEWERVGSLSPFRLPGGEAAIREPWRIATALRRLGGMAARDDNEARIYEMLNAGINSPSTSSCGRLFDAAAAELGICSAITYEGQAAIRLEYAARSHAVPWDKPLAYVSGNNVDSLAIFNQILAWKETGEDAGVIAWRFHVILAQSFCKLIKQAAEQLHLRNVALSGGVMQNSLLVKYMRQLLEDCGLRALMHKELPPGDGGLSFGQAVWGLALQKGNKA